MASYRDWTGVSEEASTLFTPLDGRWLERYSGPPFGLKKSQTGIALLLAFSLFNTEVKPNAMRHQRAILLGRWVISGLAERDRRAD